MSLSPHIPDLYSAAPYIEAFQDSTFVVKIGGEVIDDRQMMGRLARQLRVLWQLGIHLVVVHGAGQQLDAALTERGIASHKVAGRRVTSKAVLDEAVRVFHGSANLGLVARLVELGVPAIGMSGVDAGTLVVRKRGPAEVDGQAVDFGYVGDPVETRKGAVQTLLKGDLVPVFCSLAADVDGQILNINADVMACELAVALDARKLIFVSSVPGILQDSSDRYSVYSLLDAAEVEGLVKQGVIAGGMRPKVESGLNALRRGVGAVHVIGAGEEEALLEETFTNQGSGSMLVLKKDENQ